MEKQSIKLNGKTVAECSFYLGKPIKNKENFVKSIIDEVQYDKDIGYAGWRSKAAFKKFLLWSIYSNEQKTDWEEIKVKDLQKEIEEVLQKCVSVLKENKIKIFIFPTIAKFTIQKLGGVSGFSIWKNTISIGIYPTENWEVTLREIVCHELAHALELNFNERTTIGDNLVFEGVAEHFRENFIGGKKADWVESISRDTALEIFNETKSKLDTINEKLNTELFYGSERYPLWAGYAIGYYIVKDYLKKQSKLDWEKILKTPTKVILEKSTFAHT